jgi:hypothetical protein
MMASILSMTMQFSGQPSNSRYIPAATGSAESNSATIVPQVGNAERPCRKP